MLRDDAITDGPGGDSSANRQNFACGLHAWHEWRVGFQLIAAATHQNINIVDAPGVGADQDLIRPRRAWFWQVLESKNLGAAKRRADNRAH
jgi:hypothetical protein